MNRIRELRVAAGWRQQDLADKLKMAKTAVSKFELEQNDLSTEVIWKLCDVFGVTADYLLGRSSNPAPAISDEDAAGEKDHDVRSGFFPFGECDKAAAADDQHEGKEKRKESFFHANNLFH